MIRAIKPTMARTVAAASFCAVALGLSAHAEHSYEAWRQVFNLETKAGQVGNANVTDSRGNVFVAGHVSVESSSRRFYVAKYDGLDGHLIWSDEFTTGLGNCQAKAIAVDGDDNVIATGSATNQGGLDYQTIKYNGRTGARIWQKSYGGPQAGEDEGLKVAADNANNVIVTGRSRGTSSEDFFTIKYSSATGATLWGGANGGIRYNGAGNKGDTPSDLAVDSANNVIVTGKSFVVVGKTYFYTVKYSAADGAQFWAPRTVETPGDAEGVAVAIDASDNIAVTGIGRNLDNSRYLYTVEYRASNGSVIFIRTEPSEVQDFMGGAADVAFDSAGDVVITGTRRNADDQLTYYTAKYAGAASESTPGTVLWETESPSRDDEDFAKQVVIDGANDVTVSGLSEDTDNASDFYTVKYSGSTGKLLWQQIFEGVAGEEQGLFLPVGLAVDKRGNVIVTGTSKIEFEDNGISYNRIVTFKYNPLLLNTGDESPVAEKVPSKSKFTSFSAPALSDNGAIATRATVAAGKKRVDAILAQGAGRSPTLLAVKGNAAPGVAKATYKSFFDPLISNKAGENDRVAFVAKMAGVPGNKSTGVWAENTNGVLQLILQQGTPIVATGLDGAESPRLAMQAA
ncbi:MAG: hypothetical protein V4710_13275, partial [Verrucomicrobiota bacterium]